MIRTLLDMLAGKPAYPRSPQWPHVEREHLKAQPRCVICGTTKQLEVHHVLPFHLFPDDELDPANLRTVCRPEHFLIGHGKNWLDYNPHFDRDVKTVREIIATRTRGGTP